MSRADDDALNAPSEPGPGAARRLDRESVRMVLRLLASVIGVVGSVALLSLVLRPQLEALALSFIERFGLAGMFLGTFVADAFSFPIPPQFYMLTAVASGGPQLSPIVAISLASMLAGSTGYLLAARIGDAALFQRFIARSRSKLDPLFARYGFWAMAIGSVTPVPFSMLCYLAGLYRMPYRIFAVLLLFRVPRLLFFYALIRAGWGS